MSYKLILAIAVFVAAVLALVLVKPGFLSVSPYCKSLPENAVNTVSLEDDAYGCPHWYIEIRSIFKNCFCLVGGHVSCEGDDDYNSIWEGCRGALPPGCPVCPIYKYTPIADYGGLLEGYECAKDLMQNCPDGTEIVEKQCIDGFYVLTNNVCNGENPKPNIKVYVAISLLAIGLLSLIYFIVKGRKHG